MSPPSFLITTPLRSHQFPGPWGCPTWAQGGISLRLRLGGGSLVARHGGEGPAAVPAGRKGRVPAPRPGGSLLSPHPGSPSFLGLQGPSKNSHPSRDSGPPDSQPPPLLLWSLTPNSSRSPEPGGLLLHRVGVHVFCTVNLRSGEFDSWHLHPWGCSAGWQCPACGRGGGDRKL